MKRVISLILTISLFVMIFSSCQMGKTVKVNGVKVDSEVYAYFLDKEKDEAKANEAVVHYVAVNSETAKNNLLVPQSQKLKLSDRVNDLWHLYGNYYEDLGISKQTIYKIETSKEYEKTLLADYYGPNGKAPLSEKEIETFFDSNYIAVRYVTGYLFTIDEQGASVPLPEDKKIEESNKYLLAAAFMNDDTPMEEAVGNIGNDVQINDILVSSYSDENLPDGFYDECAKVPKGTSSVITLGDYVFLVERLDVLSDEYDYYDTHRNDCIYKMKSDEFKTVFAELEKNYSLD